MLAMSLIRNERNAVEDGHSRRERYEIAGEQDRPTCVAPS
jgi:hypothetical protein